MGTCQTLLEDERLVLYLKIVLLRGSKFFSKKKIQVDSGVHFLALSYEEQCQLSRVVDNGPNHDCDVHNVQGSFRFRWLILIWQAHIVLAVQHCFDRKGFSSGKMTLWWRAELRH